MSGPLTQVLGAFEAGAATLSEVASRTGLTADLVSASVAHLVRLGRLTAEELAVGCPAGGCGGCALATADGSAGCGAPSGSAARPGSGVLALSLPR